MPTKATPNELTLTRVDRAIHEWVRPALHRESLPLTVTAWRAPGEPVSFDEGSAHDGETVTPGSAWGSPWSTTWLHLTGPAPESADGCRAEVVVDLGFTDVMTGFQAEGMYWSADGRPLKGLNPRNRALTWPVGTPVDVWVEAAGNPTVHDHGAPFSPTPLGSRETAGDTDLYVLGRADVCQLDTEVSELLEDAEALRDLLRVIPVDQPRYAIVLAALDRMVDALDPRDVSGCAAAARQELADVLQAPAVASAHTAYATGHAHIDSAWLWPVRETVRKCARTFATVVTLMDQDPDLVFSCSSAQQYEWVKDGYPDLFKRIRDYVAAGRWIPVGGMWVESDTNMPGGEALARQFVFGKRFFLEELGVETRDVWLPDSFGYTGALPQIAAASGSPWMLTQKLSWNESNQMPHHTFLWEGIDGTRVLTHFPPVDTYNSDLSAPQLEHASTNNLDAARVNASIVPFGYGDGGGGPTREMLARARRYASLEGAPQVRVASPYEFFAAAEQVQSAAPVWSGEMYLEFHRGTYTSQARTKAGNRRSEHLLREAELWAATAAVRHGTAYPYDELEAAWKTVLLNQFHDILPGSSIAWVYEDAERGYAEVRETCEGLIATAIGALSGEGTQELSFNATPHAREGVAALGAGVPAAPTGDEVTAEQEQDGGWVLRNGLLTVHLTAAGTVAAIRDERARREVVPLGCQANLLQLHRDTPRQWDAWDVDAEYLRSSEDLLDLDSLTVTDGPDEVVVRIERSFGSSHVTQELSLRRGCASVRIETTVDWHEQQRFLKLAFPLAVHADRSAAEIQFGHVFRPTHANTPWDAAKFEICAHRWVHVAEPGYGVSVANSSTYGHDIRRVPAPDGTTMTLVRESLLRAPLYPDPTADQGEHRFVTVLHPGADLPDAVADGYDTNLPARTHAGGGPVEPLVSVDGTGVVVESVKLAEDRSGDVVVRLYESLGARTSATVRAAFDTTEVERTDLLERPLGDDDEAHRPTVVLGERFEMRPFEIVTLRLRR